MIIPAIIPKSLDDLKEKLELLAFASVIQIDVVDGVFVKDISWPYEPHGNPEEAKTFLGEKEFEVDLMVEDSVIAGQVWQSAGAKRLIFHLESFSERSDILSLKSRFSCEIGLSLNNSTSLEELYPYVDSIDFVQLMGIDIIGSQGQPFDVRVLERIATLRALYPKLTLSIDGAVSEENISVLKAAGVDRFAVGSNILKAGDPRAQYEKLLKIVSV